MPLTAEQIDQLRMPNPYQAPAGIANPFMSMMGGAGMAPKNAGPQGYNPDPRGMVDPEALRALAYGTEYDVEARRNAIAARLAENEMAAQAQQAAQAARVPRGAADEEIGSGMSAGVIPGSGAVVSNYLAPGGAFLNNGIPQPGTDNRSFF